jgi:carboxymethylenebutenolidase
MATAEDFDIGARSFLQANDVFLRDNQNVRRGLRIDVLEGEGVFVFVDFLGGNFSADNAAEQALAHAGNILALKKRVHFGSRWIMKKLLLLVGLLVMALPVLAASSKTVSYPSGDETVQGVLFTPEGKGPFPGLIAIHEWWGLNDWVKEEASNLADQGYLVLAIDLYRGKVATTPEVAHEIMRGVPEDRAARDLHAAFVFLESQPNIEKKRIGSIGWCMGGGYALDMALQEPRLKTAVINYGHLATDPAALKKINAAILGIFGGQDRGITSDDVRKFELALKDDGKKVEIHIYDDAGHAFENPNNTAGYRVNDAADAWQRTLKFLQINLKK